MTVDPLLTAHDVAAFINNRVRYRPGWAIDAKPSLSRTDVHVSYRYSACDTDRVTWSDTRLTWECGSRLTVSGVATIVVGDGVTVDDVVDKVAALLIAAEVHEIREFLRVDGQAPFHPHAGDGVRRWNDSTVVDLLAHNPKQVGASFPGPPRF